jgi:hypothetical protein
MNKLQENNLPDQLETKKKDKRKAAFEDSYNRIYLLYDE